ncbi:MAG: hypothetical protein II913_04600 [Elusimicrobiaceae bacterium]|jgi:hypothetical protein|nr:hypothetical protein [Elusimicrobiaceae bacterium]
MKKWTFLVAILAIAGFLSACKSTGDTPQEGERYAKKIYLTKEDYMEDLGNAASVERRDLRPNVESKYIFNVTPQNTDNPTIYFFDQHQQPKVPGEYTANDYKNEKRLWQKPKRYTPEQYYGMQGSDNSSNEDNASYSY